MGAGARPRRADRPFAGGRDRRPRTRRDPRAHADRCANADRQRGRRAGGADRGLRPRGCGRAQLRRWLQRRWTMAGCPQQRVHARRRLGLQPRVAEPHEVPPARRHVRRRVLRARGRRHVPRAGDHRRAVELPDREDRRQRARLPPARPGLREPRRVPHVQRHGLRLRRGSCHGGGDHGADDRPRVPRLGARRRGDRALRALRGQPRAAQRGHADAPRRDVRDPGRGLPGHGAARGGAHGVGGRGRGRRGARLPQCAGQCPCTYGHHKVFDGLRHDRSRARLLAREVQGARRRRPDDDRQPDDPDGAAHARLRRAVR